MRMRVYMHLKVLLNLICLQIREYLINPVESREAEFEKPTTLKRIYPSAAPVALIDGFISADKSGLENILKEYALAMDIDDLFFMQEYFRENEKRDPSVTELKLVDTYWSDHCRHTTFGTHIDSVKIDDKTVEDI